MGDCFLVYGGKDTSAVPNRLLGDVHCLHLDTKVWEEIHPQLAEERPNLQSSTAAQQLGFKQRQGQDQCEGQPSASRSSAGPAKGAGEVGEARGHGGAEAVTAGTVTAGGTGSRGAGGAGGLGAGSSSCGGMMLLAGHGGTAVGGSAMFYGGYRELVAPKPQPYLQVRAGAMLCCFPSCVGVDGSLARDQCKRTI
jgi:hypothetical protein